MDKPVGTTNSGYELVAGLEIHVQLNTQTKLFSGDIALAGSEANHNISIVSLGMPGALPVLNKAVIEKAVRMGLALNCSINLTNRFDRKSYFYADLPKGYQITQDVLPICVNGFLLIKRADGVERKIRINRIHLEEDAGKSMHDQDPAFSFIDLNRAGVPLIEIVTEPDIRSAEEAGLILSEIRKLVKHLDVGDANMEAGNLRCDANISIRPIGEELYGTRCEVKNLNSIKNLRRAVDFEFQRQVSLLGAGEQVIQSTLNFDAETGYTSPMRTKEEANDYRYFPDPDLPPIVISESWLHEIRLNMPQLPADILKDLMGKYDATQEEAALLSEDASLLKYFNSALETVQQPKSLINFLLGPVRGLLSESQIDINNWIVSPRQLAVIINLVDARKITHQSVFQRLIPKIIDSEMNPEQIAEDLKLLVVNDTEALDELIELVLQKYAAQVTAYRNGKKGVLGLFVGEIMKSTKGKFDPLVVNSMIIKKIENEKN